MSIMAVDPGRDKCGMAVLSLEGEILWRQVVETAKLDEIAGDMREKYSSTLLVLGNGTTSREAEARLTKALPGLPLKVVDEYSTTDEARRLYWVVNPPQGWRKLLPVTMQVPPEPVDDLVAVILARRELGI